MIAEKNGITVDTRTAAPARKMIKCPQKTGINLNLQEDRQRDRRTLLIGILAIAALVTVVVNLLEQEMLSHGSLTALQITQNTMNVDMSGMTLDQISAMFARLRLSPIVDSVSLSVASTEEGKAATIMDFTVRIELRQPEEVSQ